MVGRGGLSWSLAYNGNSEFCCDISYLTKFSSLSSLPLKPFVVFLISPPAIKKDFLFGNLLKWWAGVDSNHRTLAGTDLQSVAFSHSATYPYLILKLPLTGFEPVASPLPRECATPAPQRLKDLYQGSSATHLHSVNTQLTARSPCHKGLKICTKGVLLLISISLTLN